MDKKIDLIDFTIYITRLPNICILNLMEVKKIIYIYASFLFNLAYLAKNLLYFHKRKKNIIYSQFPPMLCCPVIESPL